MAVISEPEYTGRDDLLTRPLKPEDIPTQAQTGAEWERYFSLLEEANDLKQTLAPTRDSIEFAAPDDGLPVGIALTGDWHVGAGGVDYKRLRDDLALIRGTPGLYAIGMGDYRENVKPQSKAGTALYSGLFNSPRDQIIYAVLRARDAAGKWLALADGNHDAWDYRWAGIGSTADLAEDLGVPFFSEGGGSVFVTVGAQRYLVAVRHNAVGNSRLNTSNAQRRLFDDWPRWEGCDVICLAHFHFNDLHIQSRKGGRCVYLRSGTYKIVDPYATDHGFTPQYGVPLVILMPGEHKVLAFRGDDFREGVAYLKWLREGAA